jgi:hypothetical protein
MTRAETGHSVWRRTKDCTAEESGVDLERVKRLFYPVSRLALGPFHTNSVSGALFLGALHKTDHSSPSSAKIKKS